MRPVKFGPIYKQVVWGGSSIGSFKNIHLPEMNVGESWEISGLPHNLSIAENGDYAGMDICEIINRGGEAFVGKRVFERYGYNFPWIIKFIDARRNLSVQVHPDDDYASKMGFPCGKTEMWYVLKSRSNSTIYAGVARDVTEKEIRASISDYSLMSLMNSWPSKAGDLFFLPAGQIHAIGEGNLILEIQQCSDVTYRLFDYGRTDSSGRHRALHIEQALAVMDRNVRSGLKLDYDSNSVESQLCHCDYFRVNRYIIKESRKIFNNRDSFMVIICINGIVNISDGESTEMLRCGETILYPASSKELDLVGDGVIVTCTL